MLKMTVKIYFKTSPKWIPLIPLPLVHPKQKKSNRETVTYNRIRIGKKYRDPRIRIKV